HSLFFHLFSSPQDLHSFPTRRSSDLGIALSRASEIVEAEDLSGLMAALRSLTLSEEQAFLVVQCLRPERFEQTRATARFLDAFRSEEHTSELQSRENLVCRLLLEK